MTELKRKALAEFFEVDIDEIEETLELYNVFEVESEAGEYKVLTEDEADAEVRDYIEDILWAFNPSFLAGETGIDEEVFKPLSNLCESANPAIKAIIDGTCGLDSFVEAAISADGRGHFLSHYDGVEEDIRVGEEYFLIYRIN